MLGVACINVGEVVIAKYSFNAGDFGFGLLFGASGVGLAIGSFAGGMLAERRPSAALYGPAIILAGLGYGSPPLAPNVWLAAPAVVVAGIGNGAAALYNVAPDPARRARRVPRSRLHARDERHVRDPRAGDGRCRAGDDGARRPLDLGDRRRLLRALRSRRDRALAAAPRLGSRGAEAELEDAEAVEGAPALEPTPH